MKVKENTQEKKNDRNKIADILHIWYTYGNKTNEFEKPIFWRWIKRKTKICRKQETHNLYKTVEYYYCDFAKLVIIFSISLNFATDTPSTGIYSFIQSEKNAKTFEVCRSFCFCLLLLKHCTPCKTVFRHHQLFSVRITSSYVHLVCICEVQNFYHTWI